MFNLLGKKIVFVCLMSALSLFASAGNTLSIGKENETSKRQPQELKAQSRALFKSIYVAKIERALAKINKLGKQLNDNSNKIEQFSQLLQSNDQKTNACEISEKIDEMSVNITSTLDRIQKRSEFCVPNPCLNGGRCELTATGSDYECTQCPSFLGKHCEIFDCGNASACYQRNHKAYFVFESKVHITWDEAEAKCLSEGMVLAQPKDKGSTEFLIEQLRGTYGDSDNGPWFWIGFKYNADDRKWYWVDGSAMGDYIGGSWSLTTIPQKSCGLILLYSHLHSNQNWNVYDCLKQAPNRLYSLCEKPLI